MEVVFLEKNIDAPDSRTSHNISRVVRNVTKDFSLCRSGFDKSTTFVTIIGYANSASRVFYSNISVRFGSSYSHEHKVVVICPIRVSNFLYSPFELEIVTLFVA